MGQNSKIEWTTHTFNAWWGCTKISEECQHCYADTLAHRYGHKIWGPTASRKPMSESYWKQITKWNTAAAGSASRPRVFCCSMSDLFEGPETCQDRDAYRVIMDGRARLFEEIEKAPNLDFLLLSKRPENMVRFAPDSWHGVSGWPDNVWAGTSVGTQKAVKRAAYLVNIPCGTLFVSAEPLLEHVDFTAELFSILNEGTYPFRGYTGPRSRVIDILDWVIVGGESGSGARPMHPGWVRSIREQCAGGGASFFFKQWGEYAPFDEIADDAPLTRNSPYPMHRFEDGVTTYKVGKHAAGRLLDGRTYDAIPEVSVHG